MATTVLWLKTFTASDPVDYNEINDNYVKIDNGVKTAMQGRAAHNLLDNSNFRNPVNQRGKTSWADWNNYTVDRWIFRNTKVQEASIGTSGMSITTGSSEIYFEQPIEKSVMQRYIGKTLTLVFSTNEGLLIKKWTVVDGSYGRESIGNFQLTIGCMTNGWIDLVVPANKTVNIYWAALYEGSYDASTLPAYQPKGYAAELAECQRYYENSWFGVKKTDTQEYFAHIWSAQQADARIEFKQQKRISPTITFYPIGTESNWRIFNGSYQPIDNVENRGRGGLSGFIARVTKGSADGTTWTVGYTIQAQGHWEASADL